MNNYLKIFWLAAATVSLSGAPAVLDATFLDSLRHEVRTNHPTIAAARARLEAAGVAVRAVRLWEDPMAGAGVMGADREMRRDDGDLRFGVEQVLPRWKLYRAQREKARSEQKVFEAEWERAAVTLETRVAAAAIELALLDETLRISREQLGWLEIMATNAGEKMKDPSANASEALRIESELAREKQKIASSERERKRIGGQLNILLGRSQEAEWSPLTLATTPNPSASSESAMARLVQTNPMLHGLISSSEAARAGVEVAKKERSPIFSVGVDSSVYSGGTFKQTSVGAKMTIPLFNRSLYRANVEKARQEQIAAEKESEALERRLRGEIIGAWTDAENAAAQAQTFIQEVIPRAEKAAEAVQNGWISSKTSLLEVLESRRNLLNARVEERQAVAAQAAALEMLRSIVPPSKP